MVAFEIRRTARENLSGKWGKAALITFCFVIVEFVINFISGLLSGIPVLGFLCVVATWIIALPLSYGLLVSMIRLKRGDAVECFDFFTIATSNIKRVWGIVGNIILKLLPFVIVAIILMVCVTYSLTSFVYHSALSVLGGSMHSGFGMASLFPLFAIALVVVDILLIVKGLRYALSFYLLYDYPELSGKELVEKSSDYMTGNRWKLVWLQLTFIGWMFLAAFTFGIGYFWLIPYMLIASIIFYEDVSGKVTTTKTSQTVATTPEVITTTDTNNPISNAEDNNSDDQGPIILN